MADQERAVATMTPQDLLHKSNPGVFSNGALRDLTNPRDMYSILSHKTKYTEDMATKLKQELAKSLDSSGMLPKLSRTASMHEIQRNTFNSRLYRLGNKQFRSTTDVSKNDNALDVLVLSRHKTTIGDFRRVSEDNREASQSVNLPSLRETNGHNGYENKYGSYERLELPTLTEGQVLQKTTQGGENTVPNKTSDQQNSKRKLYNSDPKLDKWFADMPNEVFDKAQRALMEESIKDRLQKYQKHRGKRGNFPNANVQISVGSKVRKVPNTYLELHVDSFGKHLMHDDTDEKMNKYRLQQKSMHNLKMRDLEEGDRLEKLPEDDFTHRFNLQHRSLTTLALTKAKQGTTQVEKPKKEVVNIPTDKGLKTVNMNDRIDLNQDQFLKQKHILSNYEEYTERLAMMRAAHEQMYMVHRPTNTPAHSESSKTEIPTDVPSDKCIAKPNIVNLFLQEHGDKNTIRVKPANTETEQENRDELKMDYVVERKDCDKENELDDVDGDNEAHNKHDVIVTKIPTAYSNRSDSTGSVNSSKHKLPLKRFNKLEVFAETNGRHRDIKAATRTFNGFKTREFIADDPSNVKVYLRQQQHQAPNVVKEDGDIVRSEVRMQDVVFRFEPGEVIVSRGPPNKQHGPNRSSERARIIYGKVLTVRDGVKKDSLTGRLDEQKDNRSSVTQNTRLDYRTELARFETTAMAGGGTTSRSAREDDGAYNNTFTTQQRVSALDHVTGNAVKPRNVVKEKVQTRDVAVETDILGSEPSTARSGQMTRIAETPQIIRSGSEMSDFIVDNNDGDSLDDETDTDVEMVEALRQNGRQSV